MKDRILRHLLEIGSITSWEAIKEYGCTRLSEYIRQIREEYKVKDEWIPFTNRFDEKSKYKRYYINKED